MNAFCHDDDTLSRTHPSVRNAGAAYVDAYQNATSAASTTTSKFLSSLAHPR